MMVTTLGSKLRWLGFEYRVRQGKRVSLLMCSPSSSNSK
ncbi:hypothetical protein E2C01_074961 [Portunus trituberculatus]|uniref:Uncharacterized protein n=1 Tax=Portunus trituberculatus TaxID=210409 RepID=A0A5B7IDN6_PORTR|nr:hypothetical protein [Portunus trituberculatus]